LKKKIIWIKEITQDKDHLNACLVLYSFADSENKKFVPNPHGNSKKNTRPYNRKSEKLLTEIKNVTVGLINLNNLYDKFTARMVGNAPLNSIPSGTKQLRNHRFIQKKIELEKAGFICTKDEIYDIMKNMNESNHSIQIPVFFSV
jgi:hypothetical protein